MIKNTSKNLNDKIYETGGSNFSQSNIQLHQIKEEKSITYQISEQNEFSKVEKRVKSSSKRVTKMKSAVRESLDKIEDPELANFSQRMNDDPSSINLKEIALQRAKLKQSKKLQDSSSIKVNRSKNSFTFSNQSFFTSSNFNMKNSVHNINANSNLMSSSILKKTPEKAT